MANLEKKIKLFPSEPGIYLFYNKKKELIYVGKATSLKSRVRSYFSDSRRQIAEGRRPIEALIHEVYNIKCLVTDSVLEAIILEANTIKKFQPKYNVDLKDDKSWNYIVITKDVFPQVKTIRQHELGHVLNVQDVENVANDKQLQQLKQLQQFQHVFGPYPGLNTKATMRLLQRLFYISHCKPCEPGKLCKPCLYHQMGQCLGVCTGEIKPAEYKKKVINPLIKFLRGNKKGLIRDLEKKMKLESKQENFEEAARLRNQIKALERIHDIALLNKTFIENQKIKRSKDQNLRMEGYDISNLGETGKVGSMVVFENGYPNKSQYRKFKIKTVIGQSDVDCLAEVLERRLKHDEWKMPDVILVDGGVPQVNKAIEIIRTNKFKIPVVGIAKGPERKRNDFISGSKDQEFVKWVKENQNLLIQVRDEAHRFAIKYQRSLRKIRH
ncbi:MAG: GIY-YIG nuclease family protein [Candidatus Magasanikiibacteriota bacterium]